MLGDECFVGEDAVVGAGVKVYPFKTIEAGATVNSSIILETRGARSLFGGSGVSGLANVDMTPELAARVAMSWATTLPKGSTVVTSRDSSRAARMLKRALMAGLNAAGVSVLRPRGGLGAGHPLRGPGLGRWPAGSPSASRATTRTRSSFRFFDDSGLDISEASQRKIERQFSREDFRRVPAEEIGDIGFPPAGAGALHHRPRGHRRPRRRPRAPGSRS